MAKDLSTEKKKIGEFHVFIIVLASLVFISSLANIISLLIGQGSLLSYFGSSNLLFRWLDSITGIIASIVLFIAEIKHIKNVSWYPLFFVGAIIFVVNNTISLVDNFLQIAKGTGYMDSYLVALNIFHIGFWIFSAWFASRDK